MGNETKLWKSEDLSCTVGGIEIDGFVEFDWDKGDEVSQIEGATKILGYNIKSDKPSWSLKVKSTADCLSKLKVLRDERTLVPISMVTSTDNVRCYDSLIHKIKYPSATSEAGDVQISGFASKIKD